MFIIALTKDGASITAEASLPKDAVNFVGDYLACAHPMLSPWEQKEGRWTACVYDWEAAWWGDYVVLARIIAPPTFAPRSNETLEHAFSINAHLQRLESKRVAANRT